MTAMTAPIVGTVSVSARSAAPSAPRLRITARGRRVLAALVALPLIAVAIVVMFVLGTEATATGQEAAVFEQVMVHPGESLWGIAESIAPQLDPRDVIEDIVSINALTTQDVVAGQTLLIPSY